MVMLLGVTNTARAIPGIQADVYGLSRAINEHATRSMLLWRREGESVTPFLFSNQQLTRLWESYLPDAQGIA